MTLKLLTVVLLSTMAAFGQSRIELPAVGFFHDGRGALRLLVGVRANFLVGDAVATGIISAASSGRRVLAKTSGEVLILDPQGRIRHRQAAPEGEAIFGFTEDGAPAAAWLPRTSELYYWRISRWQAVPRAVEREGEQIVALAGDRGRLVLVVRDPDNMYWLREISLPSGWVRFQSPLPDVSEPLLLLPGRLILFACGKRLAIRDEDGADNESMLSAPLIHLEQMGRRWAHGTCAGGGAGVAIRISEARLQCYRLPEVPQ